jgi:hypothetical protein
MFAYSELAQPPPLVHVSALSGHILDAIARVQDMSKRTMLVSLILYKEKEWKP